MDMINAKPGHLKYANLSLIRKVIQAKGTATRAEIVRETGISPTTVRSLLTEMLQSGELESIGFDESSGGRKAQRYGIRTDRYHGVALCMMDDQIHSLIIDSCGEIQEVIQLEITNGDFEEAIFSHLDALIADQEMKSIGLGVPGVVEGGSYWKKYKGREELVKINLGEKVAERYGLPVIMENDLNATMIGFGRCYAREFFDENLENVNMAYIYFDAGCVSASFLADGKIVRGSNRYAGEIGMIPTENDKLLDERLSEPMDDIQYIHLITGMLGWICCILNPQYIALAGPDLRSGCIGPIGDMVSAMLPKHVAAEILYSEDIWHDYHDGMAYLTSKKMFEEVKIIR